MNSLNRKSKKGPIGTSNSSIHTTSLRQPMQSQQFQQFHHHKLYLSNNSAVNNVTSHQYQSPFLHQYEVLDQYQKSAGSPNSVDTPIINPDVNSIPLSSSSSVQTTSSTVYGQQPFIREAIYNENNTLGTRLKPLGTGVNGYHSSTLLRLAGNGQIPISNAQSNTDPFYNVYASRDTKYAPTHIRHHVGPESSRHRSFVYNVTHLLDSLLFWKILTLISVLLCILFLSVWIVYPSNCVRSCENTDKSLNSNNISPYSYNEEKPSLDLSKSWPSPSLQVIPTTTASSLSTTHEPIAPQSRSSNSTNHLDQTRIICPPVNHEKKKECPDPLCGQRGVCYHGKCFCEPGFRGANCTLNDDRLSKFLPDCSGNGFFDLNAGKCSCFEGFTGDSCSLVKCKLDCGPKGRCLGTSCSCDHGWTGSRCELKFCNEIKCNEHGTCSNGTCICDKGWNGRQCGFNGCPKDCSGRGECIDFVKLSLDGDPSSDSGWSCRCNAGWTGADCSRSLEINCNDGLDNDNDGLIDCADSECCGSKECMNNPLCFSSTDPLDVLLRKQPPSPTASFFQRMKFLIEEDSVQSYAHKQAFNDSLTSQFNPSRASVIRGRVVSPLGAGLMGVRVGVLNHPLLGFVVSRESGWFDIMVNGGSPVILHFQREPFRPTERTVIVPWNEIVIIDDVIMNEPDENRSKTSEQKAAVCLDHDHDKLYPVLETDWDDTECAPNGLLADGKVLHESLEIPGSGLSLVYKSSQASGYRSVIEITLTPETIPATLKLIHLKIAIEGILMEKSFEADSHVSYTFSWNRRNVYKQKVYGIARVLISVGYEYISCPSIIWVMKTTSVPGHDMSISEIGGWNLNIHHRYNFHEGILQKGDGTNVYLKERPKIKSTMMEDTGHKVSLPSPNSNGEYEIVSQDTLEIYVFNRHGLHIATKNVLSNAYIYNFTYVVNTSFGKLSSVTDSFNNRVQLLRDHSNQVKEIETSFGIKCHLEMSRTRMLESFMLPNAAKVTFHYNGVSGLIKSKAENTSGYMYFYEYDRNGRLTKAIGPDHENLKCPKK